MIKKVCRLLILAGLVILSVLAATDLGWKLSDGSRITAALVSETVTERSQQVIDQYVIEKEYEDTELPASYDYRDVGRAVPVRDQGQYGTCWAFAALTALETSMTPDAFYDFSRDHLNYHNHYQMGMEEGGSYIMSVAYLTAWQGPVLEKDDPYGDGYSPDDLSCVCHVQEVRMPSAGDFEAIKRTVYLHGGVESSLYMDFEDPTQDSACYSRQNYSYCYRGDQLPNHDVVIIGWDDNYPAGNFRNVPEGDGAFICQNSWGTGFGDQGIFYVSYYDTNIGIYNVAYTDVEDTDNYELLYQSDLCGWSGQLGYNTETAWFANVYEAEEDQELKAVGFYACGEDTEYRVAVISDFGGTEDLRDVQYLQSGYCQYAGYYTVELNASVPVNGGDRFAVLIQIETPGSLYPIAVEYASEELKDIVDLEDGEGYISADGKWYWERVETTQNSNLCLKAYADRKETQS